MAEQKLTKEQKKEIFERALNGERTCDLAREYGVAKNTISKIKYDETMLTNAEKLVDKHHRYIRLRIHKGAMKGVEKEHEILDREVPDGDKGTSLLYLQHQVASGLMDRDGLKAKNDDSQKIEISFTGGDFDVGMPEENLDVSDSEDPEE